MPLPKPSDTDNYDTGTIDNVDGASRPISVAVTTESTNQHRVDLHLDMAEQSTSDAAQTEQEPKSYSEWRQELLAQGDFLYTLHIFAYIFQYFIFANTIQKTKVFRVLRHYDVRKTIVNYAYYRTTDAESRSQTVHNHKGELVHTGGQI